MKFENQSDANMRSIGVSDEPADAIRKVLDELTALGQNHSSLREIPLLTNMLKDVEMKLAASPKISRSSRISFSPTVPGRHLGEDQKSAHTPGKRKNEILNTYMKNQLDLQESEWESYEKTVNELLERIEQGDLEYTELEKERDYLKSQLQESNNLVGQLEERLRKSDQVNTDAVLM